MNFQGSSFSMWISSKENTVCVCVCTFNIVKEDDSLYTFAVQVLESYDRAYINMVRVQQLSELEEVCSDA